MSAFILPDADDPESKGFWDGARENRLVVQECENCHHLRCPPHPFCPQCRSAKSKWTQASGKARLWSFVIVHGPTLPAYESFTPFPIGVVTLDEGEHLRMVGNLLAAPDAPLNGLDANTLKIGMPLSVTFLARDGVALPCWIPS